MPFLHVQARRLRAGLACAVILAATAVGAIAAGFGEGLSPAERAACGITALTPAQAAALDSLVKRDVDLARQGGVTGFSSAFTDRLSPAEITAAGIDRIPEKDREVLNGLVARALATGPAPGQAFSYAPPPAPAAPVTLTSSPPRLVLHGDVTFTAGAGSHGTNFYGSSVDLFTSDPSGKFTVGVGFSDCRVHGPIFPCDPSLLAPPPGGW